MAHFKYHEVVSLCPHCTERIVTKIACEGAPDIKEIAPSASANTLRDASKLLGRCLAALRSAGIEGQLRSDVSEWLATYQHP